MARKTIMPNIAYDTQRRSFYVTLRGAPGPEGRSTPRGSLLPHPGAGRSKSSMSIRPSGPCPRARHPKT